MHPCKGSSNVINKLTKHKHELGCIELESLDSDTVFTSCCSRPFKFLMQRPGMAHFDQVLLTEKTRKFSH